jgi:hypothetical protein
MTLFFFLNFIISYWFNYELDFIICFDLHSIRLSRLKKKILLELITKMTQNSWHESLWMSLEAHHILVGLFRFMTSPLLVVFSFFICYPWIQQSGRTFPIYFYSRYLDNPSVTPTPLQSRAGFRRWSKIRLDGPIFYN